MRADDCGVDDQVFEVRIVRHGLEDAPPDALAAPAAEAAENTVPFAERLRQITPGRAGAHDPEHGFNKHAVVAARDLGVHENVIRKWVKQFDADPGQAFPGHGTLKPEQAELERLRREVQKLKDERDILKKAAAYFAKDHT